MSPFNKGAFDAPYIGERGITGDWISDTITIGDAALP